MIKTNLILMLMENTYHCDGTQNLTCGMHISIKSTIGSIRCIEFNSNHRELYFWPYKLVFRPIQGNSALDYSLGPKNEYAFFSILLAQTKPYPIIYLILFSLYPSSMFLTVLSREYLIRTQVFGAHRLCTRMSIHSFI